MKKYLLLLLALAIILLSGCSHLLYLDSAMNHFNQGATLENQLRFQPDIGTSASPYMYYTMAYSDLNKALDKQIDDLRKDQVLGSAYTVKALCEWKLKMYDKALISADKAESEYIEMQKNSGIKMPRDMALMEALPALMEIEKAKDSLFDFRKKGEIPLEATRQYYLDSIFNPDESMAVLEQAVQSLGLIQEKTASNEDLSAYFLQSQLAGLKTWSDAIDLLRQKEKGLPEAARREAENFRKAQRDQFLEPEKAKLLEKLGELLPNEHGNSLVNYWKKII